MNIKGRQMGIEEAHSTDGGTTSFYNTNGAKDVDGLCENWSLTYFEGVVLKALVGIARGRRDKINRHMGTNVKRDKNKLLHYAKLIHKGKE